MAKIVYGYHGYEQFADGRGLFAGMSESGRLAGFGGVEIQHGYSRGETNSLGDFNSNQYVNIFGDFGGDASDVINEAIQQLRDIQAEVRSGADAYIPSVPSQYAQLKAATLAWADQLDNTIALMPGWATDADKFQRGMALVEKTLKNGQAILSDMTWSALGAKFSAFFAWLPGGLQAGIRAIVGVLTDDIIKPISKGLLWPIVLVGGGLVVLAFLAKKSGLKVHAGPIQLNGYRSGGRRKRRRARR